MAPSNAEAQKLELWNDKAKENQQSHFDDLKDCLYRPYRRRIPSICKLLGYGSSCTCRFFYGFCENDSEMILLKEVIGFAMFDKPTEEPRKSNEFTGYAKDKLEYINAVYKKVVEFQKEKNDVLMTFVYVSLIVKEGDGFGVKDVPVFRIPNPNVPNGTYFVDSIGRVYKSWQDFLCNNVLPAGRVCYPKEGVYSGNSDGQVSVDFRLTPAAKVTAKALKVTDITTSVASVAAGIGLFFPPVAVASIVAGGAAGLYGIVRSSVKLADRGKHGQKLGDKEAFLLWFSLAGSALGVGSAGLTTTARIAAQSAPKLLSQVVKGVNVFSVVVNGASVGGNVGVMIEEKDWDKQRIKILLNAIKEFVISLGPLVLEPMCDALTAKFGHTPLVKAIVWVLGFVNICPEDAEKIYKMALILIDVFHIMWQESKRITQSKWGNKISCKSNFSTNDDNDYCGERFVERFFHTIQSKRNNTRQVFHFPSDHRSWSDKGMLQLEEYNKIAQKILDVPDLQGSEIIYEGQTVYVHCGSVGAVSITSVVHKSIIVVEKFDIESTISAIENFQLRTSITN